MDVDEFNVTYEGLPRFADTGAPPQRIERESVKNIRPDFFREVVIHCFNKKRAYRGSEHNKTKREDNMEGVHSGSVASS